MDPQKNSVRFGVGSILSHGEMEFVNSVKKISIEPSLKSVGYNMFTYVMVPFRKKDDLKSVIG